MNSEKITFKNNLFIIIIINVTEINLRGKTSKNFIKRQRRVCVTRDSALIIHRRLTVETGETSSHQTKTQVQDNPNPNSISKHLTWNLKYISGRINGQE